jgi:hypothetical protein
MSMKRYKTLRGYLQEAEADILIGQVHFEFFCHGSYRCLRSHHCRDENRLLTDRDI